MIHPEKCMGRTWSSVFDSFVVGLTLASPDWHELQDGDFGIVKTSSSYSLKRRESLHQALMAVRMKTVSGVLLGFVFLVPPFPLLSSAEDCVVISCNSPQNPHGNP